MTQKLASMLCASWQSVRPSRTRIRPCTKRPFRRTRRLRVIAVAALNAHTDDVAFIRLVDLLSDRRGEVRLAAAQALARLGPIQGDIALDRRPE